MKVFFRKSKLLLSLAFLPTCALARFHYFQWGGVLGGSSDDVINGIARDTTVNIYVTGQNYSASVVMHDLAPEFRTP